jgi:DNA-binding transcriptional LysR family regulator
MNFPDLNLLVYLRLLIKHGNATKVAEELNVSQPGVSAALRRLRLLLNDPVMVRSGGRLSPTAKALAIDSQMSQALDSWERIVSGELNFEASKTNRTYSVLASDYIQYVLVPDLAQRLADEAPKASLRVIPPNPYRRLQLIIDQEVDFAIGYYHEAPEELRVRRLYTEKMVCLTRKNHPSGNQFDLAALANNLHIEITSVAQGSYSLELSDTFLKNDIQRRKPITVPSYLAATQVVLKTDYVTIFPESIARSFAEILPLEIHNSPIELPLLDISILYHNSMQADPANKWFRDLVANIVSTHRLVAQVLQPPLTESP